MNAFMDRRIDLINPEFKGILKKSLHKYIFACDLKLQIDWL